MLYFIFILFYPGHSDYGRSTPKWYSYAAIAVACFGDHWAILASQIRIRHFKKNWRTSTRHLSTYRSLRRPSWNFFRCESFHDDYIERVCKNVHGVCVCVCVCGKSGSGDVTLNCRCEWSSLDECCIHVENNRITFKNVALHLERF